MILQQPLKSLRRINDLLQIKKLLKSFNAMEYLTFKIRFMKVRESFRELAI